MLSTRLATAAVAIPILIWLIFGAPAWLFNLVVLLITFISLREFAAMALRGASGGATLTTLGGMTIAVSMLVDHSGAAVSAGIVICLAIALLGTLATARDMGKSVAGAGQILLGALYGGALLPHLIWLRELPDGPNLVFFVIASCMGSDVGGYFGGRGFGKRKLWPSVSPNKTVEGAVGSVFGALLIGSIFNAWLLDVFQVFEAIAVAVLVSVLAQIGDLLESMIKRAYGAKDSGWLLPGHGGVLDRTDSLVLPIVFIYYYAFLGAA